IGGKGGVGSSLVSAWRHDHQLTVLDRRTEPTHGVRDLVGEVEDPEALAEALEGAEAVVDLAALLPQGSEAEQLPGTARAIEVNVGAVLLALRLARHAGARSFVHISSLSVFDRYGYEPIPAGARPDATRLYGLTKRLAENALRMSVDGDATTAADWPRWTDPVHPEREAQLPHLDDGTPHPCLHPADVESAVMRALRRTRGGAYEAIAITAAPQAIDDDTAARLLDWRPGYWG